MGFLLPIHPLNSLPIWARPKASSDLGNDIFKDTNGGSRVIEVVAHSEREEACKLEVLTELQGTGDPCSLDAAERILEGF